MFYDIAISVHVHTRYSDGGGDLPDIVLAAQHVQLDCVVITDHNHQRLKELGAEGWYDDVLVLVGQEQGGHRGAHVLALGHEVTLPGCIDDLERHVWECAQAGGMMFVAHPDAAGKRWVSARDQRWLDPRYPGIHGLEIWCMMQDWLRHLTPWQLKSRLHEPERYLTGPAPSTLRMWDRWNQDALCVGIGSTDNHARPVIPGTDLRAVDYEAAFRTVRTHAVVGEPLFGKLERDRKTIWDAFRTGSIYVSRDDLADPKGFLCWIQDGAKQWAMGETMLFHSGMLLCAIFPCQCEWRVICNSVELHYGESMQLEVEITKPGIYRVESQIAGAMWILSNPFRVGFAS